MKQISVNGVKNIFHETTLVILSFCFSSIKFILIYGFVDINNGKLDRRTEEACHVLARRIRIKTLYANQMRSDQQIHPCSKC